MSPYGQPEAIGSKAPVTAFASNPKQSIGGVSALLGAKHAEKSAVLDAQVKEWLDQIVAVADKHAWVDRKRLVQPILQAASEGFAFKDLEDLAIRHAAMLISEQPEYSFVAADLLYSKVVDEVQQQGIQCFEDSIETGFEAGLIASDTRAFVRKHSSQLSSVLAEQTFADFGYFGLRTVYDRYLLKNPESRKVIETPAYFFLRVACGLAHSVEEARALFSLMASFEYMPSTPTLFNSGTNRSQMSSCYLLDSPEDSLESIYQKYTDVALLSKFAGGIGLAYHRVRSRGSLIKGTNGKSNGIVPFLKTLDSSVAAVNQGGKRKGACCVYLESWHADIYEFLVLRDNTGDEAQRTHNINIANWVPDLFMQRVEQDKEWTLFDPKDTPELCDLFGEAFEAAYVKAEKSGLGRKKVKARELYALMMKTLAQTGNGWMTFKDSSNNKGNQTGEPGNVIHLSNLCTEILEVTSQDETAVCNLGSLNLARYVVDGRFDFELLATNVQTAMTFLDRVIDINFYPIDAAKQANNRWRPVGLGIMGLQDVFFKLDLAFDSDEARALSKRIQEEVYYHALKRSCELAEEFGPHASFSETKAAKGLLQFDLWGVTPEHKSRWTELKTRIKESGLRNSLTIAIAPTATIASIVGSYECIEPQVSNIFKRETLSGEFLQVNSYLVKELRRRGLWSEDMQSQIKMAEGSIQGIQAIPEEVRKVYRTAWEIPMRSLLEMAADRGAFIDQSQSLNLFMESPTIGKVSSMYLYAWKLGLKSTYYLRSRPATRIRKTTMGSSAQQLPKGEIEQAQGLSRGLQPADQGTSKGVSDQEAVSCSLENPEACESCQ